MSDGHAVDVVIIWDVSDRDLVALFANDLRDADCNWGGLAFTPESNRGAIPDVVLLVARAFWPRPTRYLGATRLNKAIKVRPWKYGSIRIFKTPIWQLMH